MRFGIAVDFMFQIPGVCLDRSSTGVGHRHSGREASESCPFVLQQMPASTNDIVGEALTHDMSSPFGRVIW